MRKVNVIALFTIFFVLPPVIFFGARARLGSDIEPVPYDAQDTRKLGYPDFVNEVRRVSGIEVGSVTELKSDRKFIDNSKSWTFKVADDFIFMAEFSSENEASEALKNFEDRGYQYKGGEQTALLWPASPRFYKRENIIVVYSGSNSEVKDMLGDLLGENIDIQK